MIIYNAAHIPPLQLFLQGWKMQSSFGLVSSHNPPTLVSCNININLLNGTEQYSSTVLHKHNMLQYLTLDLRLQLNSPDVPGPHMSMS